MLAASAAHAPVRAAPKPGPQATPPSAPTVHPATGPVATPVPVGPGRRTEHHDDWIQTFAGNLKHDASALFGGAAAAAQSQGHNALAGAETALLDMKSGVTKVGGALLHKDVRGSLASDDKHRQFIAAHADTHSLAFKAGQIGTHVVVDTAATVALAAGGEILLGAAGLGTAAAGAAASVGLGEAGAAVAGRLALGATANAVGSGVVTAAQGGHVKDVLKAVGVGGLSVGMGRAVGELVSPLARAAADRAALAAPKLAGASGKIVKVGAEVAGGAGTGALVSAATGGNRHDIVQNALFGGALSGVGAVIHARGTPEPGPGEQGQITVPPAKGTARGVLQPVQNAVRKAGDTVKQTGQRLKRNWNAGQDMIRPGAVFGGTSLNIPNPVTGGSLGSQFRVLHRVKPNGEQSEPTNFFTSPQAKFVVPHGVPLLGGTVLTGGGTYSINTGTKLESVGTSFTAMKPIVGIPGTGIGVSAGIWGSVGQSGTLTPKKLVGAIRKPEGNPEEPFKMTINGGVMASAGWPGIKLTGGTMHTLHIWADMEGKLAKLSLNNTDLPLGPFRGLSIAWPHKVIFGGLNRLGRSARKLFPGLEKAGPSAIPGKNQLTLPPGPVEGSAADPGTPARNQESEQKPGSPEEEPTDQAP